MLCPAALVFVYTMSDCGRVFFFSSIRRHTRWTGDWSSDVCSSDLGEHLWVVFDAEHPVCVRRPDARRNAGATAEVDDEPCRSRRGKRPKYSDQLCGRL